MRTKHHHSLILALLLAVGTPVYAADLFTELPVPVAVQQCELIIEGTLTAIGEAEEQTRALPMIDRSGWLKPLARTAPKTMRLHRCEVELTRLFRTTIPNAENKKTFTFLAPALVADEIAGLEGVFRTRPLQKGARYILLLRYNHDGKTFYLPRYKVCATPAQDVKSVYGADPAQMLDPSQWPWGPSSTNGLRMAVLTREPITAGAGDETVPFLCALQNTTGAGVTVNAFAGTRPLRVSIRPTKGEAEALTPTLYRTRQPDPRSIPLIALPPGQIGFVSEAGLSAWWSWVKADLAPGAYTLETEFVVPEPEQEFLRTAFAWGRIAARPVPLRVTPASARP